VSPSTGPVPSQPLERLCSERVGTLMLPVMVYMLDRGLSHLQSWRRLFTRPDNHDPPITP
jgi:hypothetical protein